MIVTDVKERPILFSTPMVKAILEDRKTVTRRVVTPYNSSFGGTIGGWPSLDFTSAYVDGDNQLQYLHVPNPEWETVHRVFPKYDPKDILWIRETFGNGYNGCLDPNIGKEEKDFTLKYWVFKDGSQKYSDGQYFQGNKRGDEDSFKNIKWKPSIHMPRAACRLRLEIQSIRVERLRDITEEDAIREGVEYFDKKLHGGELRTMYRHYEHPDGFCYSAKDSFCSLWTKINGAESWNANPWVWRIEFKKLL